MDKKVLLTVISIYFIYKYIVEKSDEKQKDEIKKDEIKKDEIKQKKNLWLKPVVGALGIYSVVVPAYMAYYINKFRPEALEDYHRRTSASYNIDIDI